MKDSSAHWILLSSHSLSKYYFENLRKVRLNLLSKCPDARGEGALCGSVTSVRARLPGPGAAVAEPERAPVPAGHGAVSEGWQLLLFPRPLAAARPQGSPAEAEGPAVLQGGLGSRGHVVPWKGDDGM